MKRSKLVVAIIMVTPFILTTSVNRPSFEVTPAKIITPYVVTPIAPITPPTTEAKTTETPLQTVVIPPVHRVIVPKIVEAKTKIRELLMSLYNLKEGTASDIAESVVDTCEALGKEYSIHVEPYEVLGIIDVESTFNQWSHSDANAKGLMQITTPCIEEVNQVLKLKDIDPYNIHTNILIGSYFYANNKEKYGYDESLVVYNQGQRNLKRAVEYSRGNNDSYLNTVIRSQLKFKEELK